MWDTHAIKHYKLLRHDKHSKWKRTFVWVPPGQIPASCKHLLGWFPKALLWTIPYSLLTVVAVENHKKKHFVHTGGLQFLQSGKKMFRLCDGKCSGCVMLCDMQGVSWWKDASAVAGRMYRRPWVLLFMTMWLNRTVLQTHTVSLMHSGDDCQGANTTPKDHLCFASPREANGTQNGSHNYFLGEGRQVFCQSFKSTEMLSGRMTQKEVLLVGRNIEYLVG